MTVPLLLVLGIVLLSVVLLVYRHWSREVPVLMYHRVQILPGDRLSVPPEAFARQLAYLQERGFHTISLDSLCTHLAQGAPLPTRPVVITFDDAYEDNFTNALPALRQYGMTATVFAISDWVGRENDWEQYRGKPSCRTMSWEQLRAWRQAGMAVGSHTVSHSSLSRLSDEGIRHELVDSKRTLEEQLGASVDFLCYPYGDFDSRVISEAEQTGYHGALAIFEGTSAWRNPRFALRRIPITGKDIGRAFFMKVSPLHVLSISLRALERKVKRWRK